MYARARRDVTPSVKVGRSYHFLMRTAKRTRIHRSGVDHRAIIQMQQAMKPHLVAYLTPIFEWHVHGISSSRKLLRDTHKFVPHSRRWYAGAIYR